MNLNFTVSGKTEAFLLPVIQNAIEDASRYRKPGLTAILVYPMNALANDQLQRIEDYLQGSGFSGTVTVAKYDRGTPQADRNALRQNPPHILLTNYMMLEYLLVRPADREGIFANHRCRFLVLDEVHTYRGALGANIALLVRRLKAHLGEATQDWRAEVDAEERPKRYPELIPVGTSATIKSVTVEDIPRDEALRLRDQAVQEFFSKLTGAEPDTIQVYGEEIEEIRTPDDAAYPVSPSCPGANDLDLSNADDVRRALCRLADQPDNTPLEEVVRRCRLLWDLNRWLVGSPMSLTGIVERMRFDVADRRHTSDDELRREAEAGLVLGAALPDGTPSALRLRAHRFIRGGWRFHRCVNLDCGRLYPMGEERCSCGHTTAPLFLCRNCGAHYLRFVGDPETGPLRPSAVLNEQPEWMIYEHERFADAVSDMGDDEEEGARRARGRARAVPEQIRGRNVLAGSFDVGGLNFSPNENDYGLKCTLVPARTRCLCCGGTAGSRTVITPVSLGTSAAVKVLGEGLAESLAAANRDREGHDGKERLLIFSDSRQDAAHQARFIIFASRYDRLRRRLVRILEQHGDLGLQKAVEELGTSAVENHDNPHVPEHTDWLSDDDLDRIRAWEEAPLLDDLSVNAGYRGTLINLGLIGVRYHRIDEYVRARGEELANELGVSVENLEHICRCLLDEIRRRGAVSREMLRYHPQNPSCPSFIKMANWERRVPRPQGYAASDGGEPLAWRDAAEIPFGITRLNAWRRPGAGGRGPSLERILRDLLRHMGGVEPTDEHMVDSLMFLCRGNFLVSPELHGARDRIRLLQVNADVVRLELLTEAVRRRCRP